MEYIKKFNNLEEFHSYEESGKMVFPRLILIDGEDQIRYKYPVNKRDNWIVFSYVPMGEFDNQGFSRNDFYAFYECYHKMDIIDNVISNYKFVYNDYFAESYVIGNEINDYDATITYIDHNSCDFYIMLFDNINDNYIMQFPETNTFETESELYNYYIMVFPIRFGYYASGDIFYRHL